MSVRVLLAPTLDLARPYGAKSLCPGCTEWCAGCAPAEGTEAVLTVEAEYGSTVVEGSRHTAAHHQPVGSPYAGDHVVAGGRPSPCVDLAIPHVDDGVILLSHIDLDSVGGVLRALARMPTGPAYGHPHVDEMGQSFWPEAHPGDGYYSELFTAATAAFWRLAAFVDVRGPHRLAEAGARPEDVEAIRAYWAWSKTRPRVARDAVTNVNAEIGSHGWVLSLLLRGDPAGWVQDNGEQVYAAQEERKVLLAAGAAMAAEEETLNLQSFLALNREVLLRDSGAFVNHLYTTPGGAVGRAVVALNTTTGAVTVSFAEPIPGVSARDIVQALWGPDAGGHDGIAGSPRGRVMSGADLAAGCVAAEDVLLMESTSSSPLAAIRAALVMAADRQGGAWWGGVQEGGVTRWVGRARTRDEARALVSDAAGEPVVVRYPAPSPTGEPVVAPMAPVESGDRWARGMTEGEVRMCEGQGDHDVLILGAEVRRLRGELLLAIQELYPGRSTDQWAAAERVRWGLPPL